MINGRSHNVQAVRSELKADMTVVEQASKKAAKRARKNHDNLVNMTNNRLAGHEKVLEKCAETAKNAEMMSKKALVNSVVALAATVKTNERVDNLVGQVAELQAQQEGTQREVNGLDVQIGELYEASAATKGKGKRVHK